jgi:hypothetical protein
MNKFNAFKKLYIDSDSYQNEQITEKLIEHISNNKIDLTEYIGSAYRATATFKDANGKKWNVNAYCLPIDNTGKIIYFTDDEQCGVDHVKVDDDYTPTKNWHSVDYIELTTKYANEIAEIYDN